MRFSFFQRRFLSIMSQSRHARAYNPKVMNFESFVIRFGLRGSCDIAGLPLYCRGGLKLNYGTEGGGGGKGGPFVYDSFKAPAAEYIEESGRFPGMK